MQHIDLVILLSLVSFVKAEVNVINYETDCGCTSEWIERNTVSKQNARSGKIVAGFPVEDGQFPWQASLELLHPSLGFLGHWCGGVLIHKNWVLSAAHCIHNDLFNLPIPPLWTVVLGEHNRVLESGNEQRIPVEKIVLHKYYENFNNDLVLMKLSRPANLSKNSNVRKICLPLLFDSEEGVDTQSEEESAENVEDATTDSLESGLFQFPDEIDNFLRSFQGRTNSQTPSIPNIKTLIDMKILERLSRQPPRQKQISDVQNMTIRAGRRRNDKLMRVDPPKTHTNYRKPLSKKHQRQNTNYDDLPYIDCVATGWGKTNITGDLTDMLLKISVPLHNNKRCRDAYGSFVKIHGGHLCAGRLNGNGGTCVGDSGGPLQCRLSNDGPWILAGITSFGSGCSIEGYPDVYTRTSFYIKWIKNTMAYS